VVSPHSPFPKLSVVPWDPEPAFPFGSPQFAIGVIALFIPLFGVACDLVLLIVNRWLIRAMAETDRIRVLVLGFLLNLILVACLADLSLFAIGVTLHHATRDPMGLLSSFAIFQGDSGKFLARAFLTNMFTLIASSSVLIVMAVACCHRVLWPFAERSVNALYEWNIFTNKPLQVAIAVALLRFASPALRPIVAFLKHLVS